MFVAENENDYIANWSNQNEIGTQGKMYERKIHNKSRYIFTFLFKGSID